MSGYNTNEKHLLLFILFLLFTCFFSIESKGQLTVQINNNANSLAQSLAGPGISISNAVLTCSDSAVGNFYGTKSNIGLGTGVLLTTGSIFNAVGHNDSLNAGTATGTPGDSDLENIAYPAMTYDACVLQFDVYVISDSLKFDYVFASEEYPIYVNSIFNDVFAFFISGPGFVGKQNIALIPGTTIPVAINNINCQDSSPYYICNDPYNYDSLAFMPYCDSSYNCPSDSLFTTLQYNGFTTVLQAKTAVIPCQKYHLKLAITDVSDEYLDSGVFLKAGSITSTSTQITIQSSFTDSSLNQPASVAGCVNGKIKIRLNRLPSSPRTIHFGIGGSAFPGKDYQSFPDSVVFSTGDSVAYINVVSTNDTANHSFRTLIVYLFEQCTGAPYDSAYLYIFNNIQLNARDTSICTSNSLTLDITPGPVGTTYQWTPSAGLSCSTCLNPVVTPTVTTTYYVTAKFNLCTSTDSVKVTIGSIVAGAGPDVNICPGASTVLQASPAGGLNYSWSPATGLSCTSCANPTAMPNVTTTYHVTVSTGNCISSDSVVVTVGKLIAIARSNQSICIDSSVNLEASPTGAGYTYTWLPLYELSCANCPNPIASPSVTTTYTVSVSFGANCSDTASVVINVFSVPDTISVTPTTTIILGETIQLNATGGLSYTWFPASSLANPNTSNPDATPAVTTTYTVVALTPDGCPDTGQVIVNVFNHANVIIVPNAFSPNNDGHNDVFNFIALGIFNLNKFEIYNRWGELIFYTSNINEGWDGTFNGKPAPLGVYVYLITGTDSRNQRITKKGNVTLLR